MEQFLLEVHRWVRGQRRARVEIKKFGTHSARETWIEQHKDDLDIKDLIRKENKPIL